MTTRVLRTTACWAVIGVLLVGCSVARRANEAPPPAPGPVVVVPGVAAPPQAEGLDGTAGEPGPTVCSAVTATLTKQLGVSVTAKPFTWNDGGLPALDLCTLLLDGRSVTVGVSSLPKQPDALDRLAANTGTLELVPELGPEARISPSRLVFAVEDRAVRVLSTGGIDRYPSGIDRAKAVAISRAVRAVVPGMIRSARQSDSACQLSTAAAERFVGTIVQLRRDYRVNGALTCIWGSFDATVSIVESFHADTIPEATRTPPPQFAPIGRPGYYLPEQGELVFRQGRRVVRVTGLTNPSRQVPLDTLLGVVDPLLPLFIR
ncbi:hypothetical protein AB0P21_01305 [Kribbella sp. NPDC056861]|uniref:hypothetical protein n=1 Tax=Kribbella sp. NPDC056861 TaxID=3154857 RepID=UPI0034235CAE